MTGFVDIHSHLLPGIDDGPRDVAAAVAMARAASEAGIATIAATPHLRSDFPYVDVAEIGERCRQLRGEVEADGIDLEIVAGAETSLVWALEASDAELRQASYRQRGKDLLIETPSDISMLEQMLFSVRTRGYRITLGHPERSLQFQREPHRLQTLHEHGVLLQLNSSSLFSGAGARRLAEHLCREGLATAIASDGHRGGAPRPVGALRAGFDALTGIVGEPRARWMTVDAPGSIVNGEPIPPAPQAQAPRRRRFSLRRR